MRGFLSRIRPYSSFALRAMLGLLSISFAMDKVLHGMDGFYREVAAWGLPSWAAKAMAWGSLGSGFLLLVGLLARLAAVAFAAMTMLLVVKTKLDAGFTGGLDLPLLTVAGCVSILLSGAGRPSLDAGIFRRFGDPAGPGA